MVRRETDPELINKVANEEGVYDVLSTRYTLADRMDFSPLFPVTRSSCVVLSNGEDAVQVYEERAPRTWEVCTFFAKSCRGAKALKVGREMRDWMEPHADLIFGNVPDSLPNAKQFYARLGGERVPYVDVGEDRYVPSEGTEMFAWRPH